MKLFKKICLFVLALLTVFLISSNKAFALEPDQSGITDTDPYVYRTTAGNTTVVDGTANIKSIKGYTIFPNNLVKNGNFVNTSTWSYIGTSSQTVSNNILTIVANSDTIRLSQVFSLVSNHVYFYCGSFKLSNSSIFARLSNSYGGDDVPGSSSTDWQTLTSIWTCNTTIMASYPSFYFENVSLDDTIDFKNIMLVDLTEMFGSGNEPETVTEFNRIYPYGYIPYGKSVLNVKVDGLESVCFNQWNEKWRNGVYYSGIFIENANYIANKDLIKVIPNTEYYYYNQSNATTPYAAVSYYDSNNEFISQQVVQNNATFTTPSNCYYINFYINDTYGNTYNHDICINLSWSGYRNGEYELYNKYTLDLSKVMNVFPNGMSSIGTYCDELIPTKSIKRIGYAPLSTLNFSLGDDDIVSAALPDDAMTDTAGYVVGNYIGNSYIENDQVHVDIHGYSFDDDWDAIADELTVYYVLDTAVETTFDAINMTYTMSDFGTEEFKVAEGYNETAPVRHETVYADVDQQIITVESLPEATETLYLVNNIFVYLGDYYKVKKTYDEETTSYVYSWFKLNEINNAFESSYSGYEDINPIPLNKYRSFTINESDENELDIYFENISYAMVEIFDKFYSSKVNKNVYILKFYEIDEDKNLIFKFWTDELGSDFVNNIFPNINNATGKWVLYDSNETYNSADGLSYIHKFNSRPYYITLYTGLVKVFEGFRSNSLVEFETIDNKTFKGWYTDSLFTTKYSVDNQPTYPTENIILYSKFNINLYRLTVHLPDQTIYNYYEYNDDITAFNNPSLTGYTFSGVYEDSSYSTMVTLSGMPSHDYEIWIKGNPIIYTLSYYGTGGSIIHQQQYYYNQFINLYDISNVLNTDALKYQYNGWFTSSPGTTFFTAKRMPAQNVNVYINEINAGELPDNIYMITLNGMNIKYYNNVIPSGLPNGVKTGYTFVGWYYDQSLINEVHENDSISSNTVLYPKYTINTHTFSIYLDDASYNSNEDPYYSKDLNYNQNISYPTPVKEGYTFAGYKLVGGSSVIDGPKTMGDEDITLIATWINNDVNSANSFSESNFKLDFENNWYIYVIGLFALIGILGLFFRRK